MAQVHQKKIVLIIEDNDDDFEAAESSFLDAFTPAPAILRCASGHDALDFLKSHGAYASAADKTLPDLIILDLNLPGISGREMLSKIKQDHYLQRIPVVVMTSSTDQRDINACYRAGANAYVPKPMELEALFDHVSRLTNFWFETAILPIADKPPE